VTATPAHHFSARSPFDRNRALWGGFLIEAEGRRIYFAGDTAYRNLFTEIRERFGAPDLALLPIGAYAPRWFMHAVHMNPAESVQAHVDLAAKQSIGMHFGTFPLTIEPIDEPVRALGDALHAQGVPEAAFRAIDHGASVRLA
jgi:L-ascorbate metabolism protein UlaG (beta-lactamase superfamily)